MTLFITHSRVEVDYEDDYKNKMNTPLLEQCTQF